MSKKDYELIARILAGIPDDSTRFAMVERFALALHEVNPRFNIVKFVRASKGKFVTSALKISAVTQELPK